MAYRSGYVAAGEAADMRDVRVSWSSSGQTGTGARPSARDERAAAERSARDVRRVSPQMARDCLERTREEALELEQAGFAARGQAFAQVCLLKGELSDAERDGGLLLGGPDGAALTSALAALGYPDDCWAALSTDVRAAGRPWAPAEPDDLAWAIEVVDPELVIALDDKAARALRGAYAVDAPLAPGEVVRVRGRRFIALGGFADALGDPAAKRIMWDRLKRVPPLGDPL
ncbi:MAG: hypothetical protein KHY83_05305 [Coriobacteriia bacterium]|nr:hypothetical protein [Coriobacteriia bacterium]MBS5478064.1 hypothetical protein [Coriobacteriia bacterium]